MEIPKTRDNTVENLAIENHQANFDIDNESWMKQRVEDIKRRGIEKLSTTELPSPPEETPRSSLLGTLVNEYKKNWQTGKEVLKGTGELGLTLATGAVAWPISKAGQLMTMPFWGGQESKKFEQYVNELYTYQPKTESGKKSSQIVGKGLEKAFEVINFPAKGWGELAELITGSPEAKYGITTVGEVATILLLPKVVSKIKEATGITPKTPKPITQEQLALWDKEIAEGTKTREEISKLKKEARTPGDITADMEKINSKAHDEVQSALDAIPKEEWDKWYKDEKPKNISDIAELVKNSSERLKAKEVSPDLKKLPQYYQDVIRREADQLKQRADNLQNIAKEADQVGADLIVVPKVLKPRVEIPEQMRSMGDIARDLKTIVELDERGSFSPVEGLSPDKLAAYNRLKGDIAVISRNAKRVGKSIEEYLNDLGIDPEVVRFIGQKAQEGSQKEGQVPTLSSSDIRVNLDRISNSESVKKIIGDVNLKQQEIGRIAQTTRGVRSHEKTIQSSQTKKWGMSVEDVLKRKPGEIWNAEEMTSVRDIRDSTAVKIKELTDKVLEGDEVAKNDLPSALALFGEIEAQRTGASAEIGRALESHKIFSEGERQPLKLSELADLAQAVKDSAGDPTILARRIKVLETNIQKQTFSRQLVNGLRKGSDIFNFAWINGLLSGPPTHVVNFISNAATFGGALIEREIGSRIGQIGEAFGSSPGVQIGEANAMLYGTISGFMDALKTSKKAWIENKAQFGGTKLEKIKKNPLSQEALGTSGAFGKSLEFIGDIVGGPGRGLMTSDEFWKSLNYRAELQALAFREATAEGLKGKKFGERVNYIVEHPDEFSSINDAGHQFALIQTFNNELGPIGKSIMGFANSTPFTKFILPFVRTPTNILKYSLDRTPVLNAMSSRFWQDINAGGASGQMALAKLSLGIMTAATVMYLADSGFITGNGPYDKKLRNLWMQDHEPYSVKIGDTSIRYDRMDPMANIIGTAADVTTMVRDLDLDNGYQIFSAMALSFSNMMVNKTYLQGLNNLLEAIKSPDKGSEDYARQWARSLVPAVIRVGDRAFYDPAVREVNSIFDAIKSQIPGFSDELPPKRNFWGDPVVPEGSWGPNMLSPYKKKTESHDPVNEEILRNKISLSMPSRTIGGVQPPENPLLQNQPRAVWGVRLTPEQYDRLVVLSRDEIKIGGFNLHDRLEGFIKSPTYQRQSDGPDGGKSLLIRTWINQYDMVGRQQLMKEYPELERKISEQIRFKYENLRPTQ